MSGERTRLYLNLLAVFGFTLVFTLPALAVPTEVEILLDLDDDATTGCAVATVDGPFAGVEQVLVTVVDVVATPPSATVLSVATRDCADPGTGTFGPDLPFDGGWPVGLDLGEGGRDVVETWFPLAASVVPDPDVVRLGLVVRGPSGPEQALLTVDDTPGGAPIRLDRQTLLEVPTLGTWGLVLLALLLAVLALRRLGGRGGRRPAVAGLALVLLLLPVLAGVAHATTALDGLIGEWLPGHRLASDGSVLFGFGAVDRLCFRVDTDLVGNTPPVADAQALSTAEDTALAITLTGSDADSDPLTFAIVSGPDHGVLTGTPPNVTYTPDADYTGPDAFDFSVEDPSGGSDTATVTIDVSPVNDAPAVADVTYMVSETAAPGTVVGTVTFADPDTGQAHSFAFTAGNVGGAFAVDAGTGEITVAGPLDFETLAVYTITAEVTDDGMPPLTGSGTVTVNVTDADDPPVAVADAATVAEDSGATAVDVLANDTDVDGGAKTVASVTQPANGTVAITGGGTGLTYEPDADHCNDGTPTDDFTYTLNGGSSATVAMTVTCVDDPPVAVADAATVGEDSGATAIDVLANDTDVDGGAKTVASVTQPANGTVVITGGGTGLTYEPDADHCNDGTPTDDFMYTLNGGSSATVAVTVTCGDDPPVAVDDAATVAEDSGATAIDVLANDTDVDGGPKTVASVTQPANGTVAITGGGTGVTYTPDADYCNDGPPTDDFTYALNGGSSATVAMTVTCDDDAPVAVADTASVAEDSGASAIDVLANDTDVDGGLKEVQSVTQPTNGTVAITGGGTGVSYAPNADYCNDGPPTDDFTYTLNGGSSATVAVTVTCVDDAPVAVADAATVAEDSGASAIDVLANDTDVDGGLKQVQSVTQPTNGTVAITGGGTGVTYMPNANYCNDGPPTDDFMYTLNGGSSAAVAVTVTCVDDPPVAVADAASVAEDSGASSIDVLANDTDVDGGPKLVQSVTQPANGTVVITGGGTGVTYAPNANYCNDGPPTDDFTYTLNGGSSATVAVTVTCVDDPPMAVADAATVLEDSGATAVDVLANDTDPDGGPKLVQSVTQPANGTVVITGGGSGVTYEPNANYCNDGPPTDDFMYTLNGGSSATVAVTVTCVNDPPVAAADAFDFVGNTELRVDLAAAATPHALETTGSGFGLLDNDADPVENDPLTVAGVVGCGDATAPFTCTFAGFGTVIVESDGAFSFLPEAGDAGASEQFQYQLTDGIDTVVGTVTLTRVERVWYVDNSAAPGGDGTSASPFDGFTAATLADDDSDGDLTDDLDVAGDWIFVYRGDGTAGGQDGGLMLEGGQHLIGQHVGLALPVSLNGNGAPTVLVGATAGRPRLDDLVADTVQGVTARDVVPAEVAGLDLAGDVNGLDWSTTAAFAGGGLFIVRDNVVRSAGVEGIDVNLVGSGATQLALHDNTVTATGTGIDVMEIGTGTLTVTRFDDNVVSGDTGGSGILVNGAVFDSTPGGALNTVDGGTTVVGALANPVGAAGLALIGVQGDLHFTGNLTVYAGAGAGLTASGTGAGFALRVASGGPPTGVAETTGGPAVDVSTAALDLRLTALRSTNSAGAGVNLSSVTGTFSAEAGSTIVNATGTDFAISGGTADVTYKGTITDDVGQLVNVSGATAGAKAFEGAITDGDDGDGNGVSLAGNSGATVRFSGGLVLSTGANPAFTATGGGTVAVCDENPCNPASTGGLINKITTTTATALNVANTGIGAQGLEFRSIASSGGAASGIVLNTTGSAGGLKVKGTGSAGSGGTVSGKTGDGVVLNSTAHVELASFNVTGSGEDGIDGSSVTNLALTGCNVTGNGNAANEEGISLVNVSGVLALSNVTATGNGYNNLRIDNTAGTLSSFAIFGGSYSNNLAGIGNHGILIEPRGTSQITSATVSGATISGNDVMGLQLATADTAVVSSFDVDGNTIQGNELGVDVSKAGTSSLTFRIRNNLAMTGQNSHGINLFTAVGAGTTGAFRGRIENNTIGNAAVDGSGSAIGNCIRVNVNGDADAAVLVSGNMLRECPNGRGIEVIGRNGTGTLDVTVTGNDVDHTNLPFNPGTSDFPLAAIMVQSNCATICNTVRADVRSNTVPAGSSFDFTTGFITLAESGASTLQLVDTAPASGDCTAQLTSTNTGSAVAQAGCSLIAGPIDTP